MANDAADIGKSGQGGLQREHESRRVLRYPTRFAAELAFAGRRFPVMVHDISKFGVMVEGALLPEAGRTVILSAVGLSAEARVVWARQGACGMEFLTPVDPLDAVRKNVLGPARSRGSASVGS